MIPSDARAEEGRGRLKVHGSHRICDVLPMYFVAGLGDLRASGCEAVEWGDTVAGD